MELLYVVKCGAGYKLTEDLTQTQTGQATVGRTNTESHSAGYILLFFFF